MTFDDDASSILLKRHDGSDRAEMVCLAVAAVRIAVNVDDFSGLCRSVMGSVVNAAIRRLAFMRVLQFITNSYRQQQPPPFPPQPEFFLLATLSTVASCAG